MRRSEHNIRRPWVSLCVIFTFGAFPASVIGSEFYARPIFECESNADGTTPACAASAGGAGAWRGANAAGFGADPGQIGEGDTLYGCRMHDGGYGDNAIRPDRDEIQAGARHVGVRVGAG